MMEVERVANSRMGSMLKKWGVGGCPGQQLQAQGKTGWTRVAQDIAPWMVNEGEGRNRGCQSQSMQLGRIVFGLWLMVLSCCRYVQSTVPEL